ncbi:unnamed protein product [Spirodela intermedia]|uniref:Uncharacterized protein n=1 Tax=Spirodela intermedia TaxID=51605 RepID=A0A7I8KMT8_SPIIN|nr:unnamed protein product [Spirodela intermedia]
MARRVIGRFGPRLAAALRTAILRPGISPTSPLYLAAASPVPGAGPGGPARPKAVDIAARDQLVFYITPNKAIEKFVSNPSKNRFRLGGLVVEGSVVHPSASSPEMEFVITDLVTDILVRFEGSLPDLFREGHSAVVEGFLKRFEADGEGKADRTSTVSEKARNGVCFFKVTEVLAKHDEKYMPEEVAAALERNKKKIEADAAREAAEMEQG